MNNNVKPNISVSGLFTAAQVRSIHLPPTTTHLTSTYTNWLAHYLTDETGCPPTESDIKFITTLFEDILREAQLIRACTPRALDTESTLARLDRDGILPEGNLS